MTAWAVDHIGFTVPDLDRAVALFCDVLGCELVLRAGPYEDAGYRWPGEEEPEHVSLRLAIVRHAAHNVELLEYRRAPVPTGAAHLRPSAPGSAHLALHVNDVGAAAELLRTEAGAQILGPVTTETGGPMEGLEWVYALTPFGMVIELIRWQPGMPYERFTQARLAGPPALVTMEGGCNSPA
jgi:catechol 2,3-dioxygenase-like lactoylglutathione lyase family enzyme